MKRKNRVSEVVEETSQIIGDLLRSLDFSELSKRNALYKKYEADRYRYYVEMEKQRYLRVLRYILANDPEKVRTDVCDFGCMVPFLPVALAKLGYRVTLVEKYEFYGRNFKSCMSDFCRENGLSIADLDILEDPFDSIGQQDIALNLSVVEHFNGSPKHFLSKIYSCLREDGLLFFDVPNIANRVKRIRVLLGASPLDDYSDYLEAPYPYMGHNREMTMKEVKMLLESVHFDIMQLETYDFNPHSTISKLGKFVKVITSILPGDDLAEVILAIARKDKAMKIVD